MKKILLLLLAMSGSFLIYADSVLSNRGLTLEGAGALPSLKRSVENLGNGYRITYEFDSIYIKDDAILDNKSFFKISGFSNITIPGQARLPQKLEKFLVPQNVEYDVYVETDEYFDYPIEMSPALQDIAGNSDEFPEKTNIKSIELVDDLLPKYIVDEKGIQIYRQENILDVVVSPIQYNSVKKTARIHNKLSIVVTWPFDEADGPDDNTYIQPSDPFLNNCVVGADYKIGRRAPSYYPNGTYDQAYLIVTSNELMEPAIRLYEWKLKMGYNAQLVPVVSKTPEAVKNSISHVYQRNPDLTYLVFLGDQNHVPYMKPSSAIKAPYTDFYYACFDGDGDFTPDVYYGRIPVSTVEEANTVIDKIISYEEGSNNREMYTRFLSSAYFQDNNGDKAEDRDYCRTAEKIALAADDRQDEVYRLYYADRWTTPLYWSNVYYNKSSIPESVKSQIWNYNSDDMVEAIVGSTIVYHRDHGDYNGWYQPDFKTPDLAMLDNCTYPIVFSIDCLTGAYASNNNFAKEFLCMKGGCASIVAATEVTFSGRNEAFSLGMFGGLWPDANLKHDSYSSVPFVADNVRVSTLGEMMNLGMARMEESYFNSSYSSKYSSRQDREAYHIFGDPSLNIYWNSSINLADLTKVSFDNGKAIIEVEGVESATVSFNCGLTSYFRKGNYFEFDLKSYEGDVYFSVNAEGAATYLFSIKGRNISSKNDALRNVVIPDAKIGSCFFNESQKIEVAIEGDLDNELSLRVVSNSLAEVVTEKSVSAREESIIIPQNNERIYHVLLMSNNMIIDRRSILKSY